ncbi:MAG: restriction endonuclease subunit S [Aridibacter sp.]
MISLKFIPLSFISSNDEIIKQIRNTVVFSHLFEANEETTLKSYVENTQYGFTASALENGSHKLLRITDIHHSKVDWKSVPFCDCSNEEKYLLEANDILVARTGGTTGKSFFVENPPSNAVFASYLIRIRLKKDVNIEFIEAFLNSYCFWSQIVEMKSGSAQPNVNAEKLKKLVIPICDSDTQAKAVQFLHDANYSGIIGEKIKSVENLYWNNNEIKTEIEHQLGLVSQLRQAFLREAMQGKLVPQDTKDEPAEVLLEKIKAEKEKLIAEKKIKKQKPLPEIKPEEIPFEIPHNWDWCRLGNLADMCLGKMLDQIKNKGSMQPYLRNKNVRWGDFDLSDLKEMRFTEDEEERFSAIYGDLIICEGGEPGRAAIWKSKKPIKIQKAVHRVRTNKIGLQSEYLYYCILTDATSERLKEYFTGSGIQHLTGKSLSKYVIPLPPLAEQKRIGEKLEKLTAFCDELDLHSQESKTNAENLLQVALKEALEPK